MLRGCLVLATSLRSRLPRCNYLSTATDWCPCCVIPAYTTIQYRKFCTGNVPKVVYDPRPDMSEEEVKHIKLEPEPPIIDPIEIRYKYALLLSYNGQGFHGLQKNKTGNTVENRLLKAMLDAGLITEEEYQVPQLFGYRRSSRTDKGVSAARMLVSGILNSCDKSEIKRKINEHLSGPIQVMAVFKTIKTFSSKSWCDSRSYSYTCPTFAFASYSEVVQDSYRLSEEGLEDVRQLFSQYKGIHNFHNFTAHISPWDVRAVRYILDTSCSEPFEHNGLQWITIKIQGQSFLLHQIRKMIGLVIAIRRGLAGVNLISEAFMEDYAFLPIAPGFGLVLEDQHYDYYNKKHTPQGHEALCWDSEAKAIQEFHHENIMIPMMKREIEERTMFTWLRVLPCSSFEMVKDPDKDNRDRRSKDRLRGTAHPIVSLHRTVYPRKVSEDSVGDDEASISDVDEGRESVETSA